MPTRKVALNHAKWQRKHLVKLGQAEATARRLGIGRDAIHRVFGRLDVPPNLPVLRDGLDLLERPASTTSPSNGGEERATRRFVARPSRRRSPISARRSRWWTRRPAGRRFDSGERQQLQVAYGNALFQTRGYGARETTEAFARARESAHGRKDTSEQLKVDYGLWAGSFVRGELHTARAHAAAFLSDVSDRPDSPDAGVAHRTVELTHWFAGEYLEARNHLERALELFQPGRDDDLAYRFGQDAGAAAMFYLALALWSLGDIARAVSLARGAEARTVALTHVGARAYGIAHAAFFELVRGNHGRVTQHAVELVRLASEYDLSMWRAFGVSLEPLAATESGAPEGGLEAMRRGAELVREQNFLVFDGFLKIALAEAEARAGDVDRAIAILDEALATSERIGHRTFDAELHRVRGEMLLKRDPANPALAEEALQAANAVAKRQATRSFELHAALSLARLYQSTGRHVEAHAILAPALKGFALTLQMPEIAEAQGLLAELLHNEPLAKEKDLAVKPPAERECPLGAVKAPAGSHWNDGFRPDSGPYRGDPCRRALRPTAAFAATILNDRFTSIAGAPLTTIVGAVSAHLRHCGLGIKPWTFGHQRPTPTWRKAVGRRFAGDYCTGCERAYGNLL